MSIYIVVQVSTHTFVALLIIHCFSWRLLAQGGLLSCHTLQDGMGLLFGAQSTL